MVGEVSAADIERVFRAESGRAVASLVRVFGDIDIAEEAVQEAFAIAVQRWPTSGLPPSPAGWIITTARNRAIDRLRRESSRNDRQQQALLVHASDESVEVGPVDDDQLRLIFTCCHPCAQPRGAGRADPPTDRRIADPGDRPCAVGVRADDGAATGARQEQDSRRQHPVPSAARRRTARPSPIGARRRVPHLQRRPHRNQWRRADPRRPVRRGHSPRPPARRADARRGRGPGSARAAVAHRGPNPCPGRGRRLARSSR